jgi:hypothetical protein
MWKQHWEGTTMKSLNILTMMAVGVIGFCASGIARADEVLKFRLFMHATSAQTLEVGDIDGHVLAVAHWSGLASFSDGSVGTANLTGSADLVKGAGTFHTYFGVSPSKDSTLWIKVDGTAKPDGTTTVFGESLAIVVGGSGRFEGAKGDGRFLGGTRFAPIGSGAELWNDFVINVRK